jgi:hypothetical protein
MMELNIADILRIVPDIRVITKLPNSEHPQAAPSFIKCQDVWYNPEDICYVHLHQLLNAKMYGTILRISAGFTSINY